EVLRQVMRLFTHHYMPDRGRMPLGLMGLDRGGRYGVHSVVSYGKMPVCVALPGDVNDGPPPPRNPAALYARRVRPWPARRDRRGRHPPPPADELPELECGPSGLAGAAVFSLLAPAHPAAASAGEAVRLWRAGKHATAERDGGGVEADHRRRRCLAKRADERVAGPALQARRRTAGEDHLRQPPAARHLPLLVPPWREHGHPADAGPQLD